MNYVERARRFTSIRDALVAEKGVPALTVREFIGWFGAERRNYTTLWGIRRQLTRYGLVTVPDFETVHIDGEISFALVEQASPLAGPQPSVTSETVDVPSQEDLGFDEAQRTVAGSDMVGGASTEPAFRVSRLLAANTKPLVVAPDCALGEAVTLMLRYDYSQLPVMTNERDVKGVVSWESMAPSLAFQKEKPQFVRECIGPFYEIGSGDSLFQAIPIIIEHSYVLVRGEDKRITGIVTATDLTLQFQQLSEPFLLLAEIENHIRLLIDRRFTVEQLKSVCEGSDTKRVVEHVTDLTFGEYVRLFENPSYWGEIGIEVDRRVFVQELDRIRVVRNNIMHFDPDGISGEDHRSLHNFVRFLHRVSSIHRIK